MSDTNSPLGPGVVYTETVIHLPPPAFADQAPYQVLIVTLEGGRRVTGRTIGEALRIGDSVEFVEYRDQIPYFQKKL